MIIKILESKLWRCRNIRIYCKVSLAS